MPFSGQKLRQAREAAGETRESLAVNADVGFPTIVRYETGRTRPSVDRAVALASALGIDVTDLLEDDQ